MQLFDLSLSIDEHSFEVHPFGIDRISHKEGVKHLNWTMLKRTLWGKISFFLGKKNYQA